MRVELSKLDNKASNFAHEYSAEVFVEEYGIVLAGTPKISGRISRAEQKVVVEGELAAIAEVECDRCLQPLELPIRSDFKLEYVTPDTYLSLETVELAQEDLALATFDGEFIDVDEIVREQLLLAIPSHPICRESCKGFCLVCGVDRNVTDCNCDATEIDPRWMGLRDLRF